MHMVFVRLQSLYPNVSEVIHSRNASKTFCDSHNQFLRILSKTNEKNLKKPARLCELGSHFWGGGVV